MCLLGLRETYDVRFGEVISVDTGGATYQALDNGDVDIALLFTTDPALGDYVELDRSVRARLCHSRCLGSLPSTPFGKR